jgi:hypothetical protein
MIHKTKRWGRFFVSTEFFDLVGEQIAAGELDQSFCEAFGRVIIVSASPSSEHEGVINFIAMSPCFDELDADCYLEGNIPIYQPHFSSNRTCNACGGMKWAACAHEGEADLVCKDCGRPIVDSQFVAKFEEWKRED